LNELILDKKRFLKGLVISLVIGIIVILIITFVTTNQNTWISLISNFAGDITPFFSGTLPTQIYLFNKNIKNKMTLGKATMVATIMPLIKTLVFSIFTPIIFFGFKRTITNYTILSAILINGAILISLFFLFLFILTVRYPEKMIGIIFKIQHLPCILKFSKKETISHFFDRVILEIKEFHKSFSLLKENWIKLLLSTFYTIIFWSTFFLVAPMLLWGFNLNFNFFHVLVMQVIFYFILPFMPTPGGSGSAEVGFASLFSFFVPLHLLGLFIGAWRFIAFYFNLSIGTIVLLVEIKKLKKKKQKVEIK
jgi:uncharacterized protein (TIRG00374 family)